MNKKIIFALALSLFLTAGLSSCKKDRTCKCTTTDSDVNPDPTTTSEVKIKDTKKKAKDACEKLNSTLGTYTTKCEIQ